jgi:outer membrane protein, heavy metal efflux system
MHSSAEASVARATMGPYFAVGASVWREGSGDHAAAAIVSVPLPFFDPARYDEARQATLAAAAGARVDRLRVEVEREARLALHEREHTREVRTQLRENVVVPLRRALETALISFAAGTADLTVVLLARRSALAAEERLVAGMADVQRADLRVGAVGGTLLRCVQR